MKSFIQANYSNPDLVYKSLFEFVEIGWEIRNKYPEVSKFTADELGILVKEVSEMRNSFNQHNPYPRFRIQGQCEDEQASAIQTCGDAALIGAAACGLLTPTLGGAFLCGGFVYLTELACIDDANRSYEICKKYEN